MAYELADVSYGITVGEVKAKSLEDVLKIVTTPDKQWANNYTDGSTIIINSDRLILNSKKESVFLCGKEGVTITSPKKIHIDTDDDVHIFGSEIYIGLPNKGNAWTQKPIPTNKAKATQDTAYEPMVLGLKLANLLQDLIVLLKNAVMVGNSGQSFMSTQMMYNLACLQARVPEIMSTVAFIDGVSHDGVDDEPPLPDGVSLVSGSASTGTVPGGAGTAGSTTSTAGTGGGTTTTAPQNTSTPAANPAAGAGGGGGTANPVAASGSASNPTAPGTNLDGPAPTQPDGWVPGLPVAVGSVSDIGPSGSVSIQWTVVKATAVNQYKGSHLNELGSEIVIILEDPDLVTTSIQQSARNAVNTIIANLTPSEPGNDTNNSNEPPDAGDFPFIG